MLRTSSTPAPTPDSTSPTTLAACAPTTGRPARPRLLWFAAVLVGLLATVVLPVGLAAAAPAPVTPGSAIESFAPYQRQTQCEAVARPGVIAFRNLVLAAYPGTGDSGMVRSCSVGESSEHKEGRAWDWRVNTANPSDVAAVEDLLTWLLAEDEHGNAAAMMRRLGVMYVIWDSHIWKSYQAASGWQPYVGASEHRDHVHFSYSWAGALGRTSYWTGQVSGLVASPIVPVCPAASPSPSATSTPASTPPTSSPSATPRPCASASTQRAVGASATPAVSAQPTAAPAPPPPTAAPTVPVEPAAGAARQAVADSMPGPWRRR